MEPVVHGDNNVGPDQKNKIVDSTEHYQAPGNVGFIGKGQHKDIGLDASVKKTTPADHPDDQNPPAPDTVDEVTSESTATPAGQKSQDSKNDQLFPQAYQVKPPSMYVYRQRPVFGLDIGYESLKVMQIAQNKQQKEVQGYGIARFDPKIIKEGVVASPETLAKKLDELLKGGVAGKIEAQDVVMAIPATRTFIRSIVLPIDALEDLSAAVKLEIEQYTPMPLSEMYMDFSVIHQSNKDVLLLVAAIPAKIADSYLAIAYNLQLNVIALEPTPLADGRLFASVDTDKKPTLLIDFGAISSDIIVMDNGVVTTSTVPNGGETISSWLADNLTITKQESHFIKYKYGIGSGYGEQQILPVIKPQLDQIVVEVRRVIRYYEEHFTGKKIQQIVVTGGGSDLLGLNAYLEKTLGVSTKTFNPWQDMAFNKIARPDDDSRSMYVTAGGLALMTPQEIFA